MHRLATVHARDNQPTNQPTTNNVTTQPGAVLRWGRGAQAPQMLARPPPNIFGSNSKDTHC